MSEHLATSPSCTNPFGEALKALQRGWSVIPVDGQTKRSMVRWKRYQTSKPSELDLREWKDSDAFAVVTGSFSGVIVLDVDPSGLESLKGRELPVTPYASTPRGGYHYYFKAPAETVKSGTHILGKGSCVDLRAEGGYALLPGCKSREWLISPEDEPLADPPSWLIGKDINEHSNNIITKFIDYPNQVIRFNGKPIAGGSLAEYVGRPDIGLRAAEWLGVPTEGLHSNGRTMAFHCILPGHNDRKPSASLIRNSDTGTVFYRDWHCASGDNWYSLAEVRASIGYGKPVKLNPSEHATWQLRLLVEIGVIKPMEVEMLPLPEKAQKSIKRVYSGFKKLLGCKWRHTPNMPTPFAQKFAAAWSGVSPSSAYRAIRELQMEYKVIRIVGQHRHYRLWMPAKEEDHE